VARGVTSNGEAQASVRLLNPRELLAEIADVILQREDLRVFILYRLFVLLAVFVITVALCSKLVC
jgi:hypothetical protein